MPSRLMADERATLVALLQSSATRSCGTERLEQAKKVNLIARPRTNPRHEVANDIVASITGSN
jgi:hypothetical protein